MLEQVLPQNEDSALRSGIERRAAVRYLWPRTTSVCAVVGRTDASWWGHVRNISRLGIALVLPAQVNLGSLLEVDLRNISTGTERTVFVRVVHVEATEDGDWYIGGAFSRELAEEELRPLRIERILSPREDLRRWTRHSCNVEIRYTLETPATPADSDAGEGGPRDHPAQVLNISPSGGAFLFQQAVRPGDLLMLFFPGPESPHRVLARTVHVNPGSTEDWLVGCEFVAQLDDEDVQALR